MKTPLTEFALRPATDDDDKFIERLFLLTQKPLLKKLPNYDEDQLIKRFRKFLVIDDVRIVVVQKEDAGWLHLTRNKDSFDLAQLHLLKKFQNKSIGTTIIKQILDEASLAGKKVTLAVVRGNRALPLYERLGFDVTGEDDTKRYMTWRPKQGGG